MSEEKKITEGWQYEKHYSQRVYHYIVNGFSLCGRLGFYFGDLTPHTGTKGKEDCGVRNLLEWHWEGKERECLTN